MNQTARKQSEQFDVTTHYGFGENWADYAKHIDPHKIKMAEDGLFKLVPAEEIEGKIFLDIGCGSGLHALSALRGGAKGVVCVDIDPNSVKTTQSVLAQYWQQSNYRVFEYNVLSGAANEDMPRGGFDIVYSWGVLHHTGAMWNAIEKASTFTKPGGKFVIALYKKTPLCGFWAQEKRLYTNVAWLRPVLEAAYITFFCATKLALGQNPVRYIREYNEQRGMLFYTDIKDWLGGYPYESASYAEVKEKVEAMGFTLDKAYGREEPRGKGVLGSGCAEYVFTRNA